MKVAATITLLMIIELFIIIGVARILIELV